MQMNDDCLKETTPLLTKRAKTCVDAGLMLFEGLSLYDDADPWPMLMAMELRSASRHLSSSPNDAGLWKLRRILETVAQILEAHGYELLATETSELIAQMRSSRPV